MMKKAKKILVDRIVWHSVKLYLRLCKLEIMNTGNLLDEPCIMAFNHVSYFDWITAYGVFCKEMNKKIIFVGKKRLFKHWLFKHLMEYGNVICVDQEKVDKEFLISVKRTFKDGNILGMFPEGTRSEDGKLKKAQPGITRLALMNRVPVVPVGLNGFYDILPKGKKIPRIKKLSIDIGKPIYLDKYYGQKLGEKDIDDITRTIMLSIGELTHQQYNY